MRKRVSFDSFDVRARVWLTSRALSDSDDEFIYSGRDADVDDDDARSVFTTITTGRPASIVSRRSSRSVSGASASDYFTQSTNSAVAATSPYPDLTPQLSQAPDFRAPTHETSQIHSRATKVTSSSGGSRSALGTPAAWEADEHANDCRRCQRKFTFFLRKHHCRR